MGRGVIERGRTSEAAMFQQTFMECEATFWMHAFYWQPFYIGTVSDATCRVNVKLRNFGAHVSVKEETGEMFNNYLFQVFTASSSDVLSVNSPRLFLLLLSPIRDLLLSHVFHPSVLFEAFPILSYFLYMCKGKVLKIATGRADFYARKYAITATLSLCPLSRPLLC